MEDDVNGAPPNPIMGKFMGLPIIVWVGIVAVVAYLWFKHKSGSSSGGLLGGGASSSAGSGTATSSGTTTLDKGAVSISVTQQQPGPPVHGKKSTMSVPNVVGKSYPQGAAILQKAGYHVQRSSPYVGTITRESPHSGSKVGKGTMITLSGANKDNNKTWPRGGKTSKPVTKPVKGKK